MPLSGMKATNDVSCDVKCSMSPETRRSRPGLIGSTDAHPSPCQTIPAYSNNTLMYVVGVVLAKPGRISALAPLALTSVYFRAKATLLKAT
ncbi:hypothetical protein SRABI106_03641 [Rahnella aquatilis]|nr:hypothetical protein SRABI106_03641 [Rahnella aquatilis]